MPALLAEATDGRSTGARRVAEDTISVLIVAKDGDPLDVLVRLEEPTFPGCHIRARPIGVFIMSDENGEDAKVLSVAASDPRAEDIAELDDVPPHELNEIAHFFAIYKQLEPGKDTVTHGWQDRAAAEGIIEDSRHRFQAG